MEESKELKSLLIKVKEESEKVSLKLNIHLRGFLELRRPWGFSPEARRGSQGASRVVLGTSGLRACGEGECVIALES